MSSLDVRRNKAITDVGISALASALTQAACPLKRLLVSRGDMVSPTAWSHLVDVVAQVLHGNGDDEEQQRQAEEGEGVQ